VTIRGDNGLNAAIMDKVEIDKVIDIIRKIDSTTDSNKLISEASALAYDQSKVPVSKKYNVIKAKRSNRKAQLDQDVADKQARLTAIQAIKDY